MPTFLDKLGKRANVSEAADVAGVSRFTAYEWRKKDAAFAEAWGDAIERAVDGLEDKAWTRAETESDTLLVTLLKAHRPEKYRERHDLTSGGEKLPAPVVYLPKRDDGDSGA
jgi:hypothetical protein